MGFEENVLVKKLSMMERSSSGVSSCGIWPHFLISSNLAFGNAEANRLVFHAGTKRSVSPVTTRTAQQFGIVNIL
jgi:hypothetical protein